jgi:hypothetical protein
MSLTSVQFDIAQALLEIRVFEDYLNEREWFTEHEFMTRLRGLAHIPPLVARAVDSKIQPASFRMELDIIGVPRADLCVRDAAKNRVVLVEFEGAGKDELFKSGRGTRLASGERAAKRLRPWSARLEHGFSQVVDRDCAQQDGATSKIVEQAIGGEFRATTFVLVCGRSLGLTAVEGARLMHRRTGPRLRGAEIVLHTYDSLLDERRSTASTLASIHPLP